MKEGCKLLLSCCVVSMALLAPVSACAATIDFSTLPGANGSAFSTYTQSGFNVVNDGGFAVATVFGNPVPDIVGSGAGEITITRNGGGLFSFTSVDLADDTRSGNFSLMGMLAGNVVLYQNGSIYTYNVVTNTESFQTVNLPALLPEPPQNALFCKWSLFRQFQAPAGMASGRRQVKSCL